MLIHVICDALLGAANLRDIGFHFPDTSSDYKNIDSKILLRDVVKLLEETGYSIGNIDSTVALRKAKSKSAYCGNENIFLAEIMKVDEDAVSIKATTSEKDWVCGSPEKV